MKVLPIVLLVSSLCAVAIASPHFASFLPRAPAKPPVLQPWYYKLDGASISVNISNFCAHTASVTVSWSGVSNPHPDDWIGIYSPASSDVHDYMDFIYVSTVPGFQSGSGSFNPMLLNMRSDYMFRYLTFDYGVVAESNVVQVCSIPMQGHLALTDDPTEMRVMWVSSLTRQPTVYWGYDPDHLDNSATGDSTTYHASDLCNAPANITSARAFRDVGWIHDAVLTGLPPSTTVYYSYGDPTAVPASDAFSEVLHFTTAPTAGAAKPIRISVYGDMGVGKWYEGATVTAQNVMSLLNDTDFVLHIGDLSYALSVGWMWEAWFDLLYPIATRVPYMIGIGNHEYDHSGSQPGKDPSGASGSGFHPQWGNFGDDSQGECGVPPFHRFHMPDNGNTVFWYSFNYGNVHILHMSTEHDYTPGSPQYAFLEQDLAAVDRKMFPWIIFAGHRPMYTSEDYPDDYKVSLNMQTAFEDLLHKYQVDIAVWGHYHAYERTCAVYKQQCVPDGTVNIVVGTAGASLDDVDWYPKVWSLAHANDFGYGRISVDTTDTNSTLTWEFFLNSNQQLNDTVTLTKSL